MGGTRVRSRKQENRGPLPSGDDGKENKQEKEQEQDQDHKNHKQKYQEESGVKYRYMKRSRVGKLLVELDRRKIRYPPSASLNDLETLLLCDNKRKQEKSRMDQSTSKEKQKTIESTNKVTNRWRPSLNELLRELEAREIRYDPSATRVDLERLLHRHIMTTMETTADVGNSTNRSDPFQSSDQPHFPDQESVRTESKEELEKRLKRRERRRQRRRKNLSTNMFRIERALETPKAIVSETARVLPTQVATTVLERKSNLTSRLSRSAEKASRRATNVTRQARKATQKALSSFVQRQDENERISHKAKKKRLPVHEPEWSYVVGSDGAIDVNAVSMDENEIINPQQYPQRHSNEERTYSTTSTRHSSTTDHLPSQPSTRPLPDLTKDPSKNGEKEQGIRHFKNDQNNSRKISPSHNLKASHRLQPPNHPRSRKLPRNETPPPPPPPPPRRHKKTFFPTENPNDDIVDENQQQDVVDRFGAWVANAAENLLLGPEDHDDEDNNNNTNFPVGDDSPGQRARPKDIANQARHWRDKLEERLDYAFGDLDSRGNRTIRDMGKGNGGDEIVGVETKKCLDEISWRTIPILGGDVVSRLLGQSRSGSSPTFERYRKALLGTSTLSSAGRIILRGGWKAGTSVCHWASVRGAIPQPFVLFCVTTVALSVRRARLRTIMVTLLILRIVAEEVAHGYNSYDGEEDWNDQDVLSNPGRPSYFTRSTLPDYDD